MSLNINNNLADVIIWAIICSPIILAGIAFLCDSISKSVERFKLTWNNFKRIMFATTFIAVVIFGCYEIHQARLSYDRSQKQKIELLKQNILTIANQTL